MKENGEEGEIERARSMVMENNVEHIRMGKRGVGTEGAVKEELLERDSVLEGVRSEDEMRTKRAGKRKR